jgi:hypothetical protein
LLIHHSGDDRCRLTALSQKPPLSALSLAQFSFRWN